MADIKKYLDLAVGLPKLVEEIKAADAKVAENANAYADSLAGNYDAAGAAATAKTEAIADAEGKINALADGQVKLNKEAIEKLNGNAETEGSVAKAVKDAQDTLQGNIDTVDGKADANAEAIAAINNADTGILKQAKDYADAEDAKIEQEVADLEGYVGTFTHDTAKTVVEYINAKTDGIATSGNLEALGTRVTAVEGDVATIKGDYLKAADKEALQGAIDAEAERAAGVEEGLAGRIKAVEDDYLKAADKTELQGNIDTLTGVVETLRDGVDAEKVDGVKDLIDYVEEHGSEVTGMKEDISKNAEDIAGVAGRMTTAEGKITAVEGAVATKAEQSALDAAVEALEGADAGQVERIAALEAKFTDGEGSVADMVADAKQEAIDSAAADATSKANTAESNAKGHADSLNTAMNTRVEALEAIDHEHANKAELDLIASGDKAKWDAAAAKAHEHENAAELAKITDGDVAKWNAAEQNAKDYADGLNTAMTTKVDGIEGRVKANEDAIALKAAQADLTALAERVTTNEALSADNKARLDAFVAISAEEVSALFA